MAPRATAADREERQQVYVGGMAPRASAADQERQQGYDAVLLEGFRQLHKDLSEENRALREENRALRQAGRPAPGGRSSQELSEEFSSLRQEIRLLRQECQAGKWQEKASDDSRASGPAARGVERGGGRKVFGSALFTEGVHGPSDQQKYDAAGKKIVQRQDESERQPRRFGHSVMAVSAAENFRQEIAFLREPIERLNFLTIVVSIFSLVFFGISIDINQDSVVWVVVEGTSVLYFVVEICIKIVYYRDRDNGESALYGLGSYFQGKDAHWNCLDAIITVIQATDFIVNLALGNYDSYFKISLFIRGLRIILMLQDSKIMRLSVLNDLTRMLTGFLQGLPSLLWVSVLIWVVIAVQAMALRLIVRPDDSDPDAAAAEYLACVDGADNLIASAECPVYKVIGNEFCSSVGQCMFTVFRCYMGDCSKLDGTSMIPELSKHYGAIFNCAYAAGMIVVMLGIFNVVTAVFVTSVERGIDSEERTYKQKHEWTGGNVRRKLKKFTDFLHKNHNYVSSEREPSGDAPFLEQSWNAFQLTRIFSDPKAKDILAELDIDADDYSGPGDAVDAYNHYNKYRLTDVFDIDEEDGVVDAEKMLSTVARMQGLSHMDCGFLTSLKLQRMRRSILALEEMLVKDLKAHEIADRRAGLPQAIPEGEPLGAASAAFDDYDDGRARTAPAEGRPKKKKDKKHVGSRLEVPME